VYLSNMRFTSTSFYCLVGVLAIVLSAPVEAGTACQMCINDVAKSFPQCSGVDVRRSASSFSDYSSVEQACWCAIGHDGSPLMKCDPLCPPGNIENIISSMAAIATVYCKPDGSGPSNSLNPSSAPSIPSSHLISTTVAVVLTAVAMA
ncbi:hypothetical protein EC968_009071, partial [Mortierella alpina]